MLTTRRLVLGRGLRGFVDGFVSVTLAQYLTRLGFTPFEIGAIASGTLLGSAALTIGFGAISRRYALRSLLLVAAVIMIATGVGFATVSWFWLLLFVAVVGTLNPSSGDVSAFLPIEQAVLANHTDAPGRPWHFAIYNVAGTFAGAFGALASGLPEILGHHFGWSVLTLERAGFGVYAAVGFVIFLLYRRLSSEPRRDPQPGSSPPAPSSRRTVLELAALFSIDSAGSGFVLTALLVLWLHLRFHLSPATTAGVFFATGVLGGCSQLLAPRLAARLGLVRTMVFTHLPANALLIGAAFAPTGGIAIAFLATRSLFAQVDVPARQSLVMAVVPPEERASASSITNVPRSLASAATPLLAGALLADSTFGWPLIIAGSLKILYDLTLLAFYRTMPEEIGATRPRRGTRRVAT